MSKLKSEPGPESLRRRAEDRVRQLPPAESPGGAEMQRLVHQLQVHQIELEMQNETLHLTQFELENLAAEQAEKLQRLAGDLTLAEQRERERLHELLHDEVQPLLVAARLILSGLGPQTAQQDCLRVAAEACEHLGRAIQMTRNLSLRLNPPLIREQGLKAALVSLCNWVKENHGLVVDLTCAADAESDDMALRLLCFNAIRELLLNVAKHAGTTEVALTLQRLGRGGAGSGRSPNPPHVGTRSSSARPGERREGDFLRITVADHGSGFDPDAIVSGSGLAAIERRLGMIGGGMQVASQPGQGAVVTLTVPLGWARKGKEKHHAQDTDRG